ncbi:MAG: hypothetical protein FWD89_03110 [Firmicutes bacterium]|nr:hypothetical protein [Bacillota bacterium]
MSILDNFSYLGSILADKTKTMFITEQDFASIKKYKKTTKENMWELDEHDFKWNKIISREEESGWLAFVSELPEKPIELTFVYKDFVQFFFDKVMKSHDGKITDVGTEDYTRRSAILSCGKATASYTIKASPYEQMMAKKNKKKTSPILEARNFNIKTFIYGTFGDSIREELNPIRKELKKRERKIEATDDGIKP